MLKIFGMIIFQKQETEDYVMDSMWLSRLLSRYDDRLPRREPVLE